jgi:peptidoglycan/xylan/chitin deacetylase (PgdA/CDA1 family)
MIIFMVKRIGAVSLSLLLLLIVAVTLFAELKAQPNDGNQGVSAGTLDDPSTPYTAVTTHDGGVVAQPVISGSTPSAHVINVPILMYHHVGNPDTYQTYSVDMAMFEWQMDYLEKQGYHSVNLDEIASALISGTVLPDKPIAITFDDGWALQITNTLPSLLRHHMRATYYIIVNVTGRRAGVLTWDQVRQLRDAGMWIGSHTLSHGYLPGMSDTKLREELVDSRQILQQQLAEPITSLAYPGGAFDARVERMSRDAGYLDAVSVIKGYSQRSDALYRLQRVGVYGVDTQERFIAKVDQTFFKKIWPFPTGQATLPMSNPEQ